MQFIDTLQDLNRNNERKAFFIFKYFNVTVDYVPFQPKINLNSNLGKHITMMLSIKSSVKYFMYHLICMCFSDYMFFVCLFVCFFTLQKGEVTLYNPSDSLILVQLLPIAAYQDPNTVLDLLADR